MKVQKRDGTQERRVLIGMIVDPVVCGHVAAVWDKQLFKSKWSNLIGGWCIKYFNRYNKPARRSIENMFETWAEAGRDKDTVELVERFLNSLSGEYKRLAQEQNSDFLIDQASQLFNQVRLRRLADSIDGDLTDGDITKANERIAKFGHVELGAIAGVDVLRDQDAMREAFEHKRDPLIKYPGALGNFFNDALERDAFIAFMGPEKRGKTWWLIDLSWRGMLQNRKVAFFSVGDMSQHQMMRRFQCRAAKRPMKAKMVKYPTFIEHEPGVSHAACDLEKREYKKPLTWKAGSKACKEILKKINAKGTLLKLACYPNSSMSVAGINSILQIWARKGWVPDVVVIDYADILANPPGYNESRDATNASWKQLRAMSQTLHCLVVTATQADAASYRAETIDATNFSEDKRKLAHVTGMIGLNSTTEEKESQLMRLNWIVLRESEFNVAKCCHVAGCMDIGNPAIKSTF